MMSLLSLISGERLFVFTSVGATRGQGIISVVVVVVVVVRDTNFLKIQFKFRLANAAILVLFLTLY